MCNFWMTHSETSAIPILTHMQLNNKADLLSQGSYCQVKWTHMFEFDIIGIAMEFTPSASQDMESMYL